MNPACVRALAPSSARPHLHALIRAPALIHAPALIRAPALIHTPAVIIRTPSVTDFHFYTLNLELAVRNILEGLQFVPPREKVKPLPWRPVRRLCARALWSGGCFAQLPDPHPAPACRDRAWEPHSRRASASTSACARSFGRTGARAT